MRDSDRRGFTLIEVTTALAIAGLVLVGGIALIDQIGDGASRITEESRRAAREGNGERLMRRLLLDATTTTDSTKRFRGDEHSLELWTTCEHSAGWVEVCRVSLAIDERTDSSVVLGELSTGESFSLRRQAGAAEFRYFNPLGTDTSWVREWSSNVSLPTAVGLLAHGDTTVLPVSVARE
ncbi:MAG TPA: type II secretion system protein [Gemmatimonadaceae bacterium]|nr:type II secretion system protein [Gemmatimonadaceae bacterium]